MPDKDTRWIDTLPVVEAGSVGELGELVRQAAAQGQAIYPLGGRTMLDYGLPPSRPGLAVDLTKLDQIIDYPARDMTITVQAGITLSKLQETLAKENQRLPIDVPRPDQATLGGALATNASGPRRYGFGTLRDYVIGISVINGQGQEVKAGGRVVKNVAGYDLCKLYIGSLGTLGIITQVTLKLKPLPEASRLLVLGCKDGELAAALDRLSGSRTRPVCIELLNQASQMPERLRRSQLVQLDNLTGRRASRLDWALVVGFEDNADAVEWQVNQLLREAPGEAGKHFLACAPLEAEAIWRALVNFPLLPEICLTFKANLLPRAVAQFCQAACKLSAELLLKVHAGNGIVIGHLHGDLTLDRARTMLERLQDAATAAQGNVVILRCPAAWKTSLPVWGVPRPDAWLMRAIKDKLDPRGLFNPGRFVDGI